MACFLSTLFYLNYGKYQLWDREPAIIRYDTYGCVDRDRKQRGKEREREYTSYSFDVTKLSDIFPFSDMVGVSQDYIYFESAFMNIWF